VSIDNQQEYLRAYEEKLIESLTAQASSLRFLGGTLLQSDDIEALWHKSAPEYMADAVPNVADYPAVSVAWAAYFGLAIAHLWDKKWDKVMEAENAYAMIRDPRGFDSMDEYIMEEILGYRFDSQTAQNIENLIRGLANTAVAAIRHEAIEPQSELAFHVFARTVKVMFRLGAGIELYRLGYKYVKANV
jgi:hypothetical protein